jgi:hypothetical protein
MLVLPPEFVDQFGFPFQVGLVELDKTFVDDDYQRPLSSFVERIKTELKPGLLGTLVVSQRGRGDHPAGTPYAVVDGQTRREGLLHHEWTMALALIYTGLTKGQEAKLFADLQRERRNIATYYRFRAALLAGEEEAVNIQNIVEQAGFTTGPNVGKDGAISAIANLEKLYRRSPELLERSLTIFKEAWRDRFVPNGDLLGGMGWFLEQYPDSNDETLARRLSIRSPDEMRRKASAMREGTSHSGALSKYMGMVIEGVYRSRAQRL